MNGFKKHRGLKRYYRNLEIHNDFENSKVLNFENSSIWFDNWHTHFDWNGYGNTSFKRRKPHLDKLFRHFDLLIEETKKLDKGFQLYAVLLDFKSESDAVFLHTPNRNNNQFPFEISNLQRKSTLKNDKLNAYIDKLNDYEKLYGTADEGFCLIFRKDIGLAFQ